MFIALQLFNTKKDKNAMILHLTMADLSTEMALDFMLRDVIYE